MYANAISRIVFIGVVLFCGELFSSDDEHSDTASDLSRPLSGGYETEEPGEQWAKIDGIDPAVAQHLQRVANQQRRFSQKKAVNGCRTTTQRSKTQKNVGPLKPVANPLSGSSAPLSGADNKNNEKSVSTGCCNIS